VDSDTSQQVVEVVLEDRRFQVAAGGGVRKKNSLWFVVIGSALFWSWGFLCYLSPVMFPEHISAETSIGIEYGFFASQAGAATFAVFVILVSKWRSIVIRRQVFFASALLMSLSAAALFWSLWNEVLWLTIVAGVVDGICVPLFGVAWGTRYSLGSKRIRPLVVLSFLLAYLLYFVVSNIPSPVSVILVCLMPLVSWIMWSSDALARHKSTLEVFPSKQQEGDGSSPGEIVAGTWETKILPWGSLSVLLAASFIGNLVASVVMGRGYSGVESLFSGGVLVCACIATMVLVPLTARRNSLSVSSVYRITITFTAVGLVSIMVLGFSGVAFGGALVQGSALFLQVIIIVIVTQSTQELGISPLLSFSVGQGVIAAVVFLANILGKQVHGVFGRGELVLDAVCGIGLLALFFMLIGRASGSRHKSEKPATDSESESVSNDGESKNSDNLFEERIGEFTQEKGFTKREAEIFSYLVKGRSLPYIADILFVTTGTVKTHTTNIYRKLDVHSRQEVIDVFEGFNL